jgi:hypothetical protein
LPWKAELAMDLFHHPPCWIRERFSGQRDTYIGADNAGKCPCKDSGRWVGLGGPSRQMHSCGAQSTTRSAAPNSSHDHRLGRPVDENKISEMTGDQNDGHDLHETMGSQSALVHTDDCVRLSPNWTKVLVLEFNRSNEVFDDVLLLVHQP